MKKLLCAALVGALMTTYSAVAADFSKNPYGLVYDNAITENVVGKVNIHPVSYTVDGIRVAANVYTPSGYDPKKSYPAIVVAHPNGGVKEQVAGLFAEKLAGMGYITVAAVVYRLVPRAPGAVNRDTPTNLPTVLKTSTVWLITSEPIRV